MDPLKSLPEITESVLYGLKADDEGKHRILLSASTGTQTKTVRMRTVIALCSLSLILILVCGLLLNLSQGKQPAQLQVIPAGSHRNSAPVNLQTVIDRASELIQSEQTETDSMDQ